MTGRTLTYDEVVALARKQYYEISALRQQVKEMTEQTAAFKRERDEFMRVAGVKPIPVSKEDNVLPFRKKK